MTSDARVSNVIIPQFYPVHQSIKKYEYNDYWLRGGRGSTKSSFVAIEIIIDIMKDPLCNAIALRKVGDTVRKSILPTLLWAIEILGMSQYFDHIKKPTEITYLPTGQKIFLTGLDDPVKLKSIKIEKGYFKILWFEEASEFGGSEEIRSVEQSVLRGGEKFIEFVTYNPPNDPAHWINKEAALEVDKRFHYQTSYLDVPKEWLGTRFFEDAERLKKVDFEKYQHEYLGKIIGRAEEKVFFGKWKVKEFATPPIGELYQSRYFYGADWGFANDPTAVTRSFIRLEAKERNLYIDYEVGGVGIELEDLAPSFRKLPDINRWPIYADNSRPETISFLSRKGFAISGAPKWEGSVEDGVTYMKSFDNIYIHPRCIKTIEEFTKYSYKVDKNTKDILPVIVDKHNHYIDAIRYSLADYIKAKISILDVI